MQLDTFDCNWEPFDSWQGEVAEAGMPNKNILIINRRPNVGIGLGDLGNGVRSVVVGLGIWSGARWTIYCHRGFETEADVALSTRRLVMSGASYTRTDPRLTVAPSSLKSKLTPFRINWMILRRLFVPQAGT